MTQTATATQPLPSRLAWIEIALLAFCLLMLSSGLVQRLVTGEQDADGHALLRVSWLPIYALTLGLAALRWRAMVDLCLRLPFLLILTALAVISFSWSIDPSLSFRRGISIAFNTLFALYLVARFDWISLLRLVGAVWLFLGVVTVVTALVMPDIGRQFEIHNGAWRGYWFEKNEMGGHMARAALVFGVLMLADTPRRRVWGGALFLSILLVLLSTSTTALAALLIALATVSVGGFMQHSRVASLVLIWVGVAVGSALAAFITLAPDVFFGLFGKDSTLTGRTSIWDALIDTISARPWFGYGYGAFWASDSVPAHWVREATDWDVPTAHNGWLEIALAVGLVGTGLFTLSFLLTAGRALRIALEHRFGLFAIGLLAQFILFSMSESILLERNSLIWVTYVLTAGLLAKGVNGDGAIRRVSARRPRLDISRLRSAEL